MIGKSAFRIILYSIPFLCQFLFESGCTSSSKLVDQAIDEPLDTVIFMDTVDAVDQTVSDTLPSAELLAEVIDTAEQYCRDSLYEQGIAYIDKAIEIITSMEQVPDTIQKETAPFYSRIVDIYSELIPPDYFENIPGEISAMVFNRRLAQSLDSVHVSPEDSSALAQLLCNNQTEYDVPMAWNDRVYTALLFYSKGRKGPVGRWLSRAQYYLPFMKKMFTDSGLPADLAYLPLIESGFNPKAYSYAHASGIWQFIPSTGRNYGLRASYWFDERRDPIKSTKAAIQYLTKLYNQFNDWHLALAAYNCGENGVERAIRRADTSDYWGLRLPKQTMNYVPQYIAALIVAKNPRCFNYTVPDTAPFNLDTVYFNDRIDMKTLAEGIGVEERELRKINPHILRWCTPPDRSNVLLYLPAGTKDTFKEFYAGIPEDSKVKWYRYRIQYGDNLISISQKFKIPVAAIKSVNRLRTSRIVAGKYLFIPIPVNRKMPAVAKSAPAKKRTRSEPDEARIFREKGLEPVKYRVKSGDTVYELAKLFHVSAEDIMRWNRISHSRSLKAGQILTLYVVWDDDMPGPTSPGKKKPEGSKYTYTVRRGDNLYSISQKLNVPLENLMGSNDLNDSRPLIHAGQKLVYYSLKPHDRTKLASSKQPRNTTVKKDIIRYQVKRGDNLSSLSRLFDIEIAEILALNGLSLNSILKPGEILLLPADKKPVSPENSSRIVYYEVQKGDNLWRIANHHGITLNRLCKLNRITRSSIIAPGDTLRILATEEL
ncbi:MAG: LysM peptidoglycan-binding domain-containing protein [Chitinivibrionales bacterium]|nr:LysM peptidoglycan-binding domain-containing protein [Chitinivibrionales bacterium]